MDCPICINAIKKKNIITCPSCNNTACKQCYNTYIMNSGRDYIQCMHCNIRFNRTTIYKLFGKCFLTKKLLDYQKEIRFKTYQARFQEVLPYVEKVKTLKKLEEQEKKILEEEYQIKKSYKKQKYELECKKIPYTEISNLIKSLEEFKNPHDKEKAREEFRNACDKNKAIDYEIRILETKYVKEINTINLLHNMIHDDIFQINKTIINLKTKKQVNEDIVSYTRPCFTNNCKGFLNEGFHCGLCDKQYCIDCYEIKETDHVCEPSIKQNIKLLKKDTKACPKCSTGIHKIDGCNQMFCTKCHTAFDWETGKIDKGVIHNPHYYEYLRNHRDRMPTVEEIQNEFLENQCNGHNNQYNNQYNNQWIVRELSSNIYKYGNNDVNTINNLNSLINMIRFPDHFRYTIDKEREKIDKIMEKQREHWINFLLDNIDRKRFDTLTSKDYKKIEFINEYIDVLTTIKDVSYDIITKGFDRIQCLVKDNKMKDMLACTNEIMIEMRELFSFANDAYTTLSDSYQYSAKNTFMKEYKTALVA